MDEKKFTLSFGSTYSETSDNSLPGLSGSVHGGLQETAPLLFRGTESTESPSPLQSWRAVIAELKGPQSLWTTSISAIIASLCALLAGYTLGYPSSALIELQHDESFQNGSVMRDLFGAFAPLGAVFGGGIAGWAADGLGRKPTLVMSFIPNLIGWLMLAVAQFWYSSTGFKCLVLIGRFFTGFAMGWAMLCSPMYIAEISPPVLRGLYSAIPQLALAIGILIVYCVEAIPHVNYGYTSCVAVGITVIFGLTAIWLLETPRYLITKGKRELAQRNLRWLRGTKIDILGEMFEIENVLYKERKLSLKEFFSEIQKRSVYISLILLLFIMSFQQLSGINALIFYAAPILQSAGVGQSEFTALLCIGITEVITTLLTVFIVDLFGRKILLILSSGVMCISCIGLGTHLYLLHFHSCNDDFCPHTKPVAVASIMLVILGFSLGLGAIPWTLVTEIVPLRVRGFLGGFVSAVNWGCAAIVTGFYLEFSDRFGDWTAWWTFAGLNLFAIVFVAIFLPETKGKKLEIIEQQILYKYSICKWK